MGFEPFPSSVVRFRVGLGGNCRFVAFPISLLLIAIGAILIWGVTTDAEGLNIDAIGVVLIVIGLLGFLLSLLFWDRWGGGYFRRGPYEGDAVVRRRTAYPARRRARVVEEDVVDDVPPAGPPY